MKSKTTVRSFNSDGIQDRVSLLDWERISADLDGQGCAVIGPLITPKQCAEIAASYDISGIFRSHVVMARHGFGRGEYRYFSYPLPLLISGLRTALYPPLAEIANRWNETMGIAVRYPKEHRTFLDRCHEAGQAKPTPLLLQYGPGDYNCLHQDLYGEHVFPLQVAFLLAKPGVDFTGVNSFSLNSGRGCSRGRRWSRSSRAKASSFPSTIARSRARGEPIASTCDTVSAGCGRADVTPWASSFMMRSEERGLIPTQRAPETR